jgi:hypothetical protein
LEILLKGEHLYRFAQTDCVIASLAASYIDISVRVETASIFLCHPISAVHVSLSLPSFFILSVA